MLKRLSLGGSLPALLLLWWWMSKLEARGLELAVHRWSTRALAMFAPYYDVISWPVSQGWPYALAVLCVGLLLRARESRVEVVWWFGLHGGALLGWMALQGAGRARAPIAVLALYVTSVLGITVLARRHLPGMFGRWIGGLLWTPLVYVVLVVLGHGAWPGTVLATVLLGCCAVMNMAGLVEREALTL